MRCDPETGDGAGVTIQIPHKFFVKECARIGIALPDEGKYGVGMVFLPVEAPARLQFEGVIERTIEEEGLSLLGWRDTPVGGNAIGRIARASQPYIETGLYRRTAVHNTGSVRTQAVRRPQKGRV